MPEDSKPNPTAALREWFRHTESAGADAPAPDDELRDLLFFWFLLDCGLCGRIDEFSDERRKVDDEQPNWAWEFAKLAVVPARAAGWAAGLDERGFPQAYCPDCAKKMTPGDDSVRATARRFCFGRPITEWTRLD